MEHYKLLVSVTKENKIISLYEGVNYFPKYVIEWGLIGCDNKSKIDLLTTKGQNMRYSTSLRAFNQMAEAAEFVEFNTIEK